jgi:hypothetical protein
MEFSVVIISFEFVNVVVLVHDEELIGPLDPKR